MSDDESEQDEAREYVEDMWERQASAQQLLVILAQLKLLRLRERVSTGEAARRFGISQDAYERIESGRTDPTIVQLQVAFRIFGARLEFRVFPQ